MKYREPFEFLALAPSDCLFGQFFHKKYLQVVHPRIEEYFFGDLDQRDLIFNGMHLKTPFYEASLKLVKEIWLVHRLTFSFDPIVSIFHLRRGTNFSVVYMDSVGHDVLSGNDALDGRHKVGFTIIYCLCVSKVVIQCHAYLISMKGMD